MRTTVILDDELLIQAKQEAASRSVSLSELIDEALRAALVRPVPQAQRFRMVTFGDAAAPVQHEPADFAATVEAEDRHALPR